MPGSRTRAARREETAWRRPWARIRWAGEARVGLPTFGLVTAMPEEFQAMRVLLDESGHARVYGDRADYIAGSLPSLDVRLPHRLVLTLTADKGTHAAADACKSMAMSFPSVNVIVMVGIAAGVPSPSSPSRHVRLGDIVVATPAIVGYRDVVQRAEGEELRQLSPRPSALLGRADRMLQAGEYTGTRPWERWLAAPPGSALAGFGRPPEQTDVLRDASADGRVVPHPHPRVSGHRPGWPKVHRGRIGSADVSMRSARERDELATRHGLLAIEMEGAGVGSSGFLNGLEWFMVRGVSDYADEHIGTCWRPYAALAAAAYTRSLLAAVPPMAPRGGHPLADGLLAAAR
jgi:nucleoside phosphorylase